MNLSYLVSIFGQLSDGLKFTVGLFFITIIFSVPLGLILSFVRVGSPKIIQRILGGYIWLMRGTPLILQLYFFYYGLSLVTTIQLGRFNAAIVAFILNYAAYFCEIFRGGLLGVSKGQYEAAKVLGFSTLQTNVRIVIPQMLRITLPSVANEFITLVKDTSLITVLAIDEILNLAKKIVNSDVNISAYAVVAVYYLIATFLLTKLFEYLEKKFAF
ncbi:MAG: amino acid ABC transporter permease [Clostridiaceae bacterium]|nr:amino acid ABC transporter permease [Clostridiaceae bacterium]